MGVTDSRRRPRWPPTKSATKGVAGDPEQLGRGAVLLQNPALAEDGNAVGEPDRLVQVVRDEDDGLVHLAPAPAGIRPAAGCGRSGRSPRRARPSAAPADRPPAPGPRPPADADRPTAGPGSDWRRSWAPDRPARGAPGPRVLALLVPSQQPRDGRHIGLDGQMGEESDILNHVADTAAQRNRIHAGDVVLAEQNSSGRRLNQSVDHF